MKQLSFAKQLEKASRVESNLSDKISEAIITGKLSQVRYRTNRYVNSFHTKLWAVNTANGKLKKEHRLNRAELVKLAGKLDPWNASSEASHMQLVPKENKDDEARPLTTYGIERKALQYLLRNALKPMAKSCIHKNQYSIFGGRDKAIEKSLQYLQEGFEVAIQIDIKNCYHNFNGEVLSDLLNLPDELVRNVVLGYDLPYIIHYNGSHIGNGDDLMDEEPFCSIASMVRRGIPQGSSLSPLVCDILISQINIKTDEFARLVIYADNFLILAKNDEAANLVADKLRAVLLNHPAGPLTPIMIPANPNNGEFDFLGYSFFRQGPLYSVRPSNKNLNKFNLKYQQGLSRIPSLEMCSKGHLRILEKLTKRTTGWCNSFKLWENSETYKNERVTYIKNLCQNINERLIPQSTE